jgi:hypothetical protein
MALTANFSVGPQDGWVRVVSAPVAGFFSVRHFPEDIPVHYAVATGGPPALNAQGVRANDAEFWANGALGGTPGVFATGTLTFTANPSANQNIVINGVTWTFVASGATGNQTNIQGTLALTLQQLVGDLTNEINGQRNSALNVIGFSASATVLTLTAKNYGTAPNSYTLSAGTTTATASAATLAGGTAGSSVDIYARINNSATDKVRIYTFQN